MTNKIKTSAVSEQHVTASTPQTITDALLHKSEKCCAIKQLVAKYHQPINEIDLLALQHAFNDALFEIEEKNFKEYVKYVAELTNGFQKPNNIAYNHTNEIEIRNLWIECVNDQYLIEILRKEVISELAYNFPTVNEVHLVEDWLVYFANESGVEIANIKGADGKKLVFAVGYSK